jgi:hypothetical protein
MTAQALPTTTETLCGFAEMLVESDAQLVQSSQHVLQLFDQRRGSARVTDPTAETYPEPVDLRAQLLRTLSSEKRPGKLVPFIAPRRRFG